MQYRQCVYLSNTACHWFMHLILVIIHRKTNNFNFQHHQKIFVEGNDNLPMIWKTFLFICQFFGLLLSYKILPMLQEMVDVMVH